MAVNFRKYKFQNNALNVIGSFNIEDETGQNIGRSEGYTIKRRTILLKLNWTDKIYEITKRGKGYFLILQGEDVVAAFKIHSFFARIELRTSRDSIINFMPSNLNKTLLVKHKGEEIGIVNVEDWYRGYIALGIIESQYTDLIFGVILGIAYNFRSSTMRFFA